VSPTCNSFSNGTKGIFIVVIFAEERGFLAAFDRAVGGSPVAVAAVRAPAVVGAAATVFVVEIHTFSAAQGRITDVETDTHRLLRGAVADEFNLNPSKESCTLMAVVANRTFLFCTCPGCDARWLDFEVALS
jgi:hypothetical protein